MKNEKKCISIPVLNIADRRASLSMTSRASPRFIGKSSDRPSNSNLSRASSERGTSLTTVNRNLFSNSKHVYVSTRCSELRKPHKLTNLVWRKAFGQTMKKVLCVSAPIPLSRESSNQFMNRVLKTVASLILKPGLEP